MVRILSVLMTMFILSASAEPVGGSDRKFQESFWQLYTEALRGDMAAQYKVGMMYEEGTGVERDLSKAALWYEKSAWQGYADAQYTLALMYAEGRGVAQNEERAMIWLAKAARQGDKKARKLLMATVDGKLVTAEKKLPATKPAETQPAETKQVETKAAESRSDMTSGEIEAITPITLTTKEGAQVCTPSGECSAYKAKTRLTSKSKRGQYYKISGIATRKGWKAYEKEGWIHEESVTLPASAAVSETGVPAIKPSEEKTSVQKLDIVNGGIEEIAPVTLITKEGAQVCTPYGDCSVYKAKTTLTSKSKLGKYYKISGIGTKEGWKPFRGEGWIDEGNVDIRR